MKPPFYPRTLQYSFLPNRQELRLIHGNPLDTRQNRGISTKKPAKPPNVSRLSHFSVMAMPSAGRTRIHIISLSDAGF
jgi:hypothetical protein